MMQGIRYFSFEIQVSPFQVGNGCLHHDLLQRASATRRWKRTRNREIVFDLDQQTPLRHGQHF